MTVTEQRFVTRKCGHRIPSGREKCPYCVPPRLSAEPLAEEFRKRAKHTSYNQMSIEIATRLGMSYERVERHVRRIVSGDVKNVSLDTADRFCVALGGVLPATLWKDEWEMMNPVEPHGDEEWG
jgi:hypothetical protein